MSGINSEIISNQIRSIIMVEFFNYYNELEFKIRQEFVNSLPDFTSEIKNKLYFLYGGKISTFFDNGKDAIKLDDIVFQKDEDFNKLTINQIIKFCKKNNLVEAFMFNIPSVLRPMSEFDFHSCINKLINMRNKMAHEMKSLAFRNSDIIELLPIEHIIKEDFPILRGYDIQKMDDETLGIASNLIYIKIILETLSNK